MAILRFKFLIGLLAFSVLSAYGGDNDYANFSVATSTVATPGASVTGTIQSLGPRVSAAAAPASTATPASQSSAPTTPSAGATSGSGSSTTPTRTPTHPTAADAARLLEQATFGVMADDTAHVQSVGIAAYLAEQLAAPMSRYTGYTYTPHTAPRDCDTHPATPTDASSICHRDKYTNFQVQRDFFAHALHNPDQLRQRVAFALSHILVVSGIDIDEAYGMAGYQNILLKDAFGNFRTLLQDVTLSPAMGEFLDMADNAKADAAHGTAPNENYAREIMQLFSIGLFRLNPDGTQITDASGAPIATYDQNVIDGLASVFTGWTYAPLPGAASQWTNPINYSAPMVPFASQHEPGAKLLLNGVTVPAGQSPARDLEMTLDNIFNHPNVGPFIGKQLIQHLVTSNPSPAYVARISAVFANNGAGVRGDLGAVVKAILTDVEARGDAPAASDFGHVRDPVLFITAVLRSLGGRSDGVYPIRAGQAMSEYLWQPLTVFDFYPPSYQIPGTPLLGPQFALDDAATALQRANFVSQLITQGGIAADPTVAGSTGTYVDMTALDNIPTVDAAVAQMNQILMHGSLSSAASAIIIKAANAQSPKIPHSAVKTALYLILTSGQYQVAR